MRLLFTFIGILAALTHAIPVDTASTINVRAMAESLDVGINGGIVCGYVYSEKNQAGKPIALPGDGQVHDLRLGWSALVISGCQCQFYLYNGRDLIVGMFKGNFESYVDSFACTQTGQSDNAPVAPRSTVE
ncbi:hypothetical protein CC80DRAFT_503027 [Byssothecium circinans]|uniref:Uncharacterized protein n=1 Tax=Byssothecium circinans TaxID=147558 RepID=A0A6A5U0W3_9PLEO|nr:hypothetical protein CC80DRAFT_503027 [Byssothecium circinans]